MKKFISAALICIVMTASALPALATDVSVCEKCPNTGVTCTLNGECPANGECSTHTHHKNGASHRRATGGSHRGSGHHTNNANHII